MCATRNDARRGGIHVVVLTVLALGFAGVPASAASAAPDVTAPDAPTGLFLDDGSSWRAANMFRVWWNNPPGQETPIAVAHYELCPAVPIRTCTTHQASGAGISALHLAVPSRGAFWLRVWLEDDAGNTNANVKSAHIILRFDDVAPPGAVLHYDGAWLGSETPLELDYVIGIHPGSAWPLSGIRGYSLAFNDATPDNEVEVFATQDYGTFRAVYPMHLTEGITAVGVRTISNTGVPSDGVFSVAMRVDRSPPTFGGDRFSRGDHWYRERLLVPLKAQDQGHLSGMSPAPPEAGAEDGGHLAYELDGGVTKLIRGDRTSVAVTGDGRHTLSYR